MKRSRFFRLSLFPLLAALLLCACSSGRTEGDAPDGGVLFEGEDYSFYYAEEWQVDRSDGMTGIKNNIADDRAVAYASISVMAFTLSDSDQGANNYWDDYRADLTDVYGERIQFTSEKEEMELGGVPACRNRYTLQLSEDDLPYRFEQTVCVRYGVAYLVTFTVPEGGYDDTVGCYEMVLSTFAFD